METNGLYPTPRKGFRRKGVVCAHLCPACAHPWAQLKTLTLYTFQASIYLFVPKKDRKCLVEDFLEF